MFTRDYQVFLRHLRAVRERYGLTQAQLAERLNETQSVVSKCERGDKRLDIVEVIAFCRGIGIPFSQFALELEKLMGEDN